jgi:hypothetical protein
MNERRRRGYAHLKREKAFCLIIFEGNAEMVSIILLNLFKEHFSLKTLTLDFDLIQHLFEKYISIFK